MTPRELLCAYAERYGMGPRIEDHYRRAWMSEPEMPRHIAERNANVTHFNAPPSKGRPRVDWRDRIEREITSEWRLKTNVYDAAKVLNMDSRRLAEAALGELIDAGLIEVKQVRRATYFRRVS